MSILVCVKAPAAMVIAADSRLTLVKDYQDGHRELCQVDCAQKVFTPGPPNTQLAIGFYGDASSGIRALGDLIAEWKRSVGQRLTVEACARSLHAFLSTKGIGENCLMVCGYDETAYFGRCFELLQSGVTERHLGPTGITLGGQKGIAEAVESRLQIPLDLMPASALERFARYLIQAEIDAQSFHLGFAGVGGPIQVAVLEREVAARLV